MNEMTVNIFGKDIVCNFNYGLMGRVLGTLKRNGVSTTISGLREFTTQFSTNDYDVGEYYALFGDLAKQFDPEFDPEKVEGMSFTKIIEHHSSVLTAVTMLLIDRDPIDGEPDQSKSDSSKKK